MDILEEMKTFQLTEKLSDLLWDETFEACMMDVKGVQIKRWQFKTNRKFICVVAGISVHER